MGGNHRHQSSSTVTAVFPLSPNPIVQLQARFKEMEVGFKEMEARFNEMEVGLQARFNEMEVGFKSWFAKQPLPARVAMRGAVVTAIGSVRGVVLGSLLINGLYRHLPVFDGVPLIPAQNFAVFGGTDDGISFVMECVCGVKDIPNSMAAGFGSGTMFALVCGMGGQNPAVNAAKLGVVTALVKGGLFKLAQPPAEDVYYTRTRSMLAGLGLKKYEKNFKRGLLTDRTLPLLTESTLKDVEIPPGPRLVILDHISRATEIKGGQ